MTPTELGTIGVYLSAVISSIGFLVFAGTARFWRTSAGWHVFWYMLMVSWVLDLSSVSHLWDPPWFAWTRTVTFVIGFPVVLAWRSWIVFDLQLVQRWRKTGAYRQEDSHPVEEQT